MALTAVYGPTNRNPSYSLGEYQYAQLKGDGTEVMVAAGGGVLARVNVGVVGTLAKFYDTPAGGTTDDTTLIATVNTSVLGIQFDGPVTFSKGLTVITTGAGTYITVAFSGRPTVSSLSFGS